MKKRLHPRLNEAHFGWRNAKDAGVPSKAPAIKEGGYRRAANRPVFHRGANSDCISTCQNRTWQRKRLDMKPTVGRKEACYEFAFQVIPVPTVSDPVAYVWQLSQASGMPPSCSGVYAKLLPCTGL